jgi:hypothetical protein
MRMYPSYTKFASPPVIGSPRRFVPYGYVGSQSYRTPSKGGLLGFESVGVCLNPKQLGMQSIMPRNSLETIHPLADTS